jgi:hypothetical protein
MIPNAELQQLKRLAALRSINLEKRLSVEEDYIDVAMETPELFTPEGWFIEEADVRVAGVVWRVYKYDADPLPSRPHAHCIDGAKRYIGLKLHLGTRELYDGPRGLKRYLAQDQFDRLIAKVRPKFPEFVLPLPT